MSELISESQQLDRVKTILAREWKVPLEAIPETAALNHFPAWDSLGHIRLMLALEAEFDFEITADTVQELTSLPRIMAYLRAQQPS